MGVPAAERHSAICTAVSTTRSNANRLRGRSRRGDRRRGRRSARRAPRRTTVRRVSGRSPRGVQAWRTRTAAGQRPRSRRTGCPAARSALHRSRARSAARRTVHLRGHGRDRRPEAARRRPAQPRPASVRRPVRPRALVQVTQMAGAAVGAPKRKGLGAPTGRGSSAYEGRCGRCERERRRQPVRSRLPCSAAASAAWSRQAATSPHLCGSASRDVKVRP